LQRVAEAPSPRAEREAADVSLGEGIRVLAAEDNATNQLVLRTFLEMAGCEVVTVGDGAEALAEWERQDWALILMDIQMPIMDGIEATRAIRASEKISGRARTPIIALTANTMAHQIDGYRRAGIDAHIAKPINAEALYSTIAALLVESDTAKVSAA
jgi:CheY-like chemotaxis protein